MLSNIIGAVVISIVSITNWKKLLNKSINFKDYRLYIGFILMTILLIINFFSVNSIVKTILVVVIFTISIIYIFRSSLNIGIVLAIYNQIIYIISEISVVVLFLFITNVKNKYELVEMFSGTIHANIFISILVFIIIQYPFVERFYQKVISYISKEKLRNIIILVFIVASTTSFLFNLIYYTNKLISLSLAGLMLMIAYLIFIFKGINIRNNYLSVNSKYNSALESLKTSNNALSKYRVFNHENKNQLMMIRNMLGMNAKNEVNRYIDKIVNIVYPDDEDLKMKTALIMDVGLRALIYSKLLYMKNNNLIFDLEIDRKIENIQLIELDEKIILDICKIVGVFLDNAIEEVEKMDDGSISIEIYILDNKFNISVANTFEGTIDFDKIYEAEYTTKGGEHGYGLTLVKELIEKNPKLENVRMINDDVFIQVLKISI